MAQHSKSALSLNKALPSSPHAIQPYLQKGFLHPSISSTVSLFNTSTENLSTWPQLKQNTTNQILLYPGSFNPPHQGHLATIRYFAERRDQLGIVALFVFADPDEVVRTKDKKWGDIVLPRDLRNTIFTKVPELSELLESEWLHLLEGDMESHIQALRITTDPTSEAGWDVKLVGFLGVTNCQKIVCHTCRLQISRLGVRWMSSDY